MAKIVIEVADGKGAGNRPGAACLRECHATPTFLEEKLGRLLGAGHEQVGQVVSIPVLQDKVRNILKARRQVGRLKFRQEGKGSQIAVKEKGSVGGFDGEQIQLASDVKIDQSCLFCLEISNPGKHGRIGDQAIGRYLKNLHALIGYQNGILLLAGPHGALMLQVADQTLRVACLGQRRHRKASCLKTLGRLDQQLETLVRIA